MSEPVPSNVLPERGARRRPVWRWLVLVFALVAAVGGAGTDDVPPVDQRQIEEVRQRIRQAESHLASIESQASSARKERERLQADVDLAEARVEETELLLTSTRNEIVRLKAATSEISQDLDRRRSWLTTHLELTALLGRPGPMQLYWDGIRGGHLEDALGVVVTLTAGQARMVQEFDERQQEMAARQAELSKVLDRADREVAQLRSRREEAQTARVALDHKLAQLDRQERSAKSQLDEMKARAAALERLLRVVGQKQRMTGGESIERYQGALPWPSAGTIVQTFGRHYVPKYSTYTVCNGLWFSVAAGAEVKAVFAGQVAFARHFKGYGNMVVVDHGGGYYSLVAGLSSIHVRLDQRVAMGTRLGLAGLPTEGGNLYFEIRVDGKPEDPKRWLQLK